MQEDAKERDKYIRSLKTKDKSDQFRRLKEGMYHFSKAYKAYDDEPFGDVFEPLVSASSKEIQKLEKKIGFALPQELVDFYTKIGRLSNEGDSFTFWLDRPADLVHKPWEDEETPHTLGLVDVMIDQWGGDRPELQDPESRDDALKRDEVDYLNNHFKCVGGWINFEGVEASYYLIFDRDGNFDVVFYHQDDFADAATKLRSLIQNGIEPKSQSLQTLIVGALDQLTNELLEELEDM